VHLSQKNVHRQEEFGKTFAVTIETAKKRNAVAMTCDTRRSDVGLRSFTKNEMTSRIPQNSHQNQI